VTPTKPVIRITEDTLPGAAEACDAVTEALVATLLPLLPQHGIAAILDGLMSSYVSLAIHYLGVAQTQDALHRTRENVPRMAAAIRGRHQPPRGRA
jgi:hypothetical protein